MKPTILLIEDNEQNRYLATFLLEQHGYKFRIDLAEAKQRAMGK